MDEESRGTPIRQLEEVPVGVTYLGKIRTILTDHGAALIETRDCTHYPEAFKEFTVVFPEGTRQAHDLVVGHSNAFTLYFPDGYALHGIQHLEGGPTLQFLRKELE